MKTKRQSEGYYDKTRAWYLYIVLTVVIVNVDGMFSQRAATSLSRNVFLASRGVSSSSYRAPSIVRMRSETPLIHASRFELKGLDGERTEIPFAPVFLAKREDSRAVNFAKEATKAATMPNFGGLPDVEASSSVQTNRKPLGVGIFNVHNYRSSSDILLMKFPCLVDALDWTCRVLRALESVEPAGREIVDDMQSSEEYAWLQTNGYIGGVHDPSQRETLWKGAPPRLRTSKLMYRLAMRIRQAQTSAEIFAFPLPPLENGRSITVGEFAKIGGLEAGIHDANEIILFDPSENLTPTGVEESRGMFRNALGFMKSLFDEGRRDG